ncbi:MAG: hypothetical protein NVSMB6_28460 [Burkholderiaceae bacterium]
MKQLSSIWIFILWTLALLTTPVLPCPADSGSGSIAYIRSGKTPGDEIRLIDPDGSHDRQIWKLQGLALIGAVDGVTGLSWRPDGKELAFSSDHDSARSYYESNIYATHPDGTGLRRLTDAPDPGELGKFSTGKVVVIVHNNLVDTSNFIVYVTGAQVGQGLVLPAGGSKTLTFDSVADFGAHPHAVVAMHGKTRWILPGPVVHAGQTANAGALDITAHGYEHFGYIGPTWRSDGKEVGCILGGGAGLFKVPAHPAPGEVAAHSMIGGKEAIALNTYDLGPTPATVGQILYAGGPTNYSIRLTKEGSGEAGTALVDHHSTEYVANVTWLPDASGFLYSINNFLNINIYRYDFATKKVTPLTHFEDEACPVFCPSPDGKWIVFERRKMADKKTDLWIMRTDGSDMRLLVHNGAAPAWGW